MASPTSLALETDSEIILCQGQVVWDQPASRNMFCHQTNQECHREQTVQPMGIFRTFSVLCDRITDLKVE